MEFWSEERGGFLPVPALDGWRTMGIEVAEGDAAGVQVLRIRVAGEDRSIQAEVPWVRVSGESNPVSQGFAVFRVLVRASEAGSRGDYSAVIALGGQELRLLLRVGAATPATPTFPASTTPRRTSAQGSVRGPATLGFSAALVLFAVGLAGAWWLGWRFLRTPVTDVASVSDPAPAVASAPTAVTAAESRASPGSPQTAQGTTGPSMRTGSETPGTGEFLMPETALRPLRHEDLANRSPRDLALIRNEIYARHGRPFQDRELRTYFESKPWYREKPDYSDVLLSETERANAAFIQRYQQDNGLVW